MPNASALDPVERHDWLLSVGVGAGEAKVNITGAEADPGWEEGASPEFRAGLMIGKHLMIGAGNRQWVIEGGVEELKIRANTQNWNLLVTVFPGSTENWTSGFFVQAGYGISNARISLLEPIPGGENEWGETYEVLEKLDERGWGASFGGGYEARVSTHFAVGLEVIYNYVDIGGIVFDTAEFFPGGLVFTWYF